MKDIAEILAMLVISAIVIFGGIFIIGSIFNIFWPLLLEIIGELGNAWRG